MKTETEDRVNAVLGIERPVVERLLREKAAAADPDLLAVARSLQPEDPLPLYEELGGAYQAKE